MAQDPSICPQCQRPMLLAPLRPFPILSQLSFGLSFVIFMIFFDRVKQYGMLIWAWCLFQIALGLYLMRRRQQARRKIYRCVVCTP